MRRIVTLSLLVVVAACSSTDSPEAEESILRFLPEDASALVYVDFNGLRESPFAREFVEQNVGIQVPEALEDFSGSTGFDPDTSVRQLMGASTGSGDGVLMVASADFDQDRVTQYLSDEGMTYDQHAGVQLFRPEPGNEAVVAFDEQVILAGTESQVRNAIDRSRGDVRSALNNPELLEEIRTVGDGYQVWATGRIDAGMLPDDFSGMGPVEFVRSLERGTYQMRIDEQVTARAVGVFTDPEQASAVANLLEGLRGMAMLQGSAGEFGELLSAILVSRDDSTVAIELQVETSVLERLVESGALSR